LLTLDTSVVVAAEQRQTRHDLPSIDRLIDLAVAGVVKLQLCEAYERDFARYPDDEGRQRRLAWLRNSPVIPRRASGGIRLGVSSLDGNDLLATPEQAEVNQWLTELLGVRGTRPSKAYSDIDHLLAHLMAGAAAFVTVDSKTILRHREQLRTRGVTVVTPAEALRLVDPGNATETAAPLDPPTAPGGV
jgi:hypothetical protein